MNEILENYLTEIEDSLHLLPKARRAEELREVRQHLQNSFIVNQAFGQPEDEAVANVLEQFGSADSLGHDLVRTWQREIKASRRSFWGAAVCTLVLSLGLQCLLPLAFAYLMHKGQIQIWGLWSSFLSFGFSLVTGMASGLAFPKKAVAGTAFAAVALSILYGFLFFYEAFKYGFGCLPSARPIIIGEEIWFNTFCALITVLASWMVSRRRMRTAFSAHN